MIVPPLSFNCTCTPLSVLSPASVTPLWFTSFRTVPDTAVTFVSRKVLPALFVFATSVTAIVSSPFPAPSLSFVETYPLGFVSTTV